MNAGSQSFEHVSWIPEGVGGEPAAHRHHEQADDAEGDHGTDVICQEEETLLLGYLLRLVKYL